MVEVCKRLKDTNGFLRNLNHLLRINPKNTSVLSEIALHYEEAMDYRNAGHFYSILLTHRPESIRLMQKVIGCFRARKGKNPNREEECQLIHKEHLSKMSRFGLFCFYKHYKQNRMALKLLKE